MTFCEKTRRLFVVFFILLAVAEALWAVHLPVAQGAQSGRHFMLAFWFCVVALVIFIFDWWKTNWTSTDPQ